MRQKQLFPTQHLFSLYYYWVIPCPFTVHYDSDTILSGYHNHFVYIIIKHICIWIHKCNLWTNTHTKWCTAISTWLMQLMTFNVEISFFWCISEEPDDELYDDCAATFIPNGSSGPPPLPSSPRSPQHSATQLSLPPPPPLPMSNSSGTLERDASPNPPPSPGGQRKG